MPLLYGNFYEKIQPSLGLTFAFVLDILFSYFCSEKNLLIKKLSLFFCFSHLPTLFYFAPLTYLQMNGRYYLKRAKNKKKYYPSIPPSDSRGFSIYCTLLILLVFGLKTVEYSTEISIIFFFFYFFKTDSTIIIYEFFIPQT